MRKTLQTIMTALCLAAAVSGYWIWSAQQLRDGLAEQRRQADARGRQISYQDPEISGFPLKLDVSLTEPSIDVPGRWHWSGPTIEAQSWLFRPQDVAVSAAGDHQITLQRGSKTNRVSLTLRQASAELHIGATGRVAAADMVFNDITGKLRDRLHFDLAALTAFITRTESGDKDAPPGIDLALSGQDFTLYSDLLQPFSNKIESLSLKGRLHDWRADDWNREVLQDWRDRGGHLDVDRLGLVWNGLTVTASGQLGLDEQLRPQGELDAWWRGLPDLVDQLTAAKMIKAEAGMVMKFGLMALANRTAADGITEVNLPLVFDDGQLSLGLIPLAALRPL